MKKLMFTLATFVVLAGTTFAPNTAFAAGPKPKPTTPPTSPATPDSIPPTCPLSDPRGCGIFD